MTKPLVERYEQILAQDPASTVFVELAKALIEKGDFQRAIEVCQQGLQHHPGSVIGRVLWGKGLIHLGRPAEAMDQFDKAIAIDKENPHAYNLISEVLLQKGLYRSALPILKKAVALQPNDGRVRQWLEQTQRVLAGGPAPVMDGPPSPALAPLDPDLPVVEPPPGGFGDTAADEEEPTLPPEARGASGEKWSIGGQQRAPGDGPPVLFPVEGSGSDGGALAGWTRPEVTEPISLDPSLLEAPQGAPSVVPSPDLLLDVEVSDPPGAGSSGGSNLLGDLGPPPPDDPAPAPMARPARPAPKDSSGARRSLLAEIPEQAETSASVEMPKVELSLSATKAIAEEYERELREKLAQAQAKKTFLQAHGAKLAVAAVLLVALGVGAGAFLYTRSRNLGRDLKDALAAAKKGIAQDTETSYKDALKSLAAAVEMDEDSVEAWALTAYAHSLLFAEHGGSNEEKTKAQAALAKPKVEEKFPALALATRYYLADSKAREQVRQEVLSSTFDQTEVHELKGRILLSQKDTKGAVEAFKAALDASAGNVRALVALGNYYREFGDFPRALTVYGTAGQLSPLHPERVVGAAECRLELNTDLDESLKEVEALPANVELPPDLLARKELVHGRLLSAAGQHERAIKKLADGAKGFRTRAYEFNMALGDASRAGGDEDTAQKAFEAALKARPKSEEAQEGLGRVLIARDREKELLARLVPEGDARKVFLVRGMAYAKLGDWKRARSELGRTQVNGKYPPEAIVYLALADAAEGQSDRAVEVLEKALAASKKAKAYLRVALGQVYWQRQALDKARFQFEEALKEPFEYEGGCALGRLYLSLGQPDAAIDPLNKSVARNGSHGEARHALVKAYLMVGRPEEALKQAAAWGKDSPTSGGALRDEALALLLTGKAKEAEAAINRSVKLEGGDEEAQRVRAQVLFARGDLKGGFSALERANKLNPKNGDTFCEIGHAFVRQGNMGNALKAYEASLRDNAQLPCGRIGTHLAKLPSGAKQAIKELGELAASAPDVQDRALAQATIARAELSAGALKEARKAAEEAVKLAPWSGQAHYVLGTVALRQKDDPKAKEALLKAEELEPVHSGVHLALADLLMKSGEDLNRALTEYNLFLQTGGTPADQARVKRMLPNLKKKLASR